MEDKEIIESICDKYCKPDMYGDRTNAECYEITPCENIKSIKALIAKAEEQARKDEMDKISKEYTEIEIALNLACHALYDNQVGIRQPHEHKKFFLDQSTHNK